MFLRFGYVVGQAGVWYALAIVAAIRDDHAVDHAVPVGHRDQHAGQGRWGVLPDQPQSGRRVRRSIGLVFFLAQAVSVAMYVIGFAEAFVTTLPTGQFSPVVVATIANLAVFVCVFIGAGWTIKVQYVILAVLAAALLVVLCRCVPALGSRPADREFDPAFHAKVRTSSPCSPCSSPPSRASWRGRICRAICGIRGARFLAVRWQRCWSRESST